MGKVWGLKVREGRREQLRLAMSRVMYAARAVAEALTDSEVRKKTERLECEVGFLVNLKRTVLAEDEGREDPGAVGMRLGDAMGKAWWQNTVLSEDRRYRWNLWRRCEGVGSEEGFVLWIIAESFDGGREEGRSDDSALCIPTSD